MTFTGQDCVSGCSLASLLKETGNSLQIGDKLFSDFAFKVASDNSTVTRPKSASEINVVTDSVSGNFGFNFQGGFFATANSSVDVLLDYKVSVLNPNNLISGISLTFNGNTTNTKVGFAEVVESVFAGGTLVAQNSVGNPGLLQTFVALPGGYTSLLVRKNVLLFGGTEDNARATISFIDQGIQQTAIPTPALLPGLVGFGVAALRKRKAKATQESEA
jgi:hypothetical protein